MVLSSIIIEDLSKQCEAHSSNALAYFYFETSGGSEKHDIAALRSLVAQFSKQSEEGMTKLKDLYHSCDKGRQQPTNNELLSCLKAMVQSFTATYVLLDALDECKNRPELLQLIQNVNRWQLENLHILVMSRREADISEVLEMLAEHEKIIELDPSSNNNDINFYIQDRLSNGLGLKRWRKRPDIQARIKVQLLEEGDGMYELAQTASLDEKALGSLPSTIGETYELMLSDIRDLFKLSSIKAFHETKFDPEWRMPEPDASLRVCSSLINITVEEHKYTDTRLVKLAHLSVKEYLLSDTIRVGRASGYAVDDVQGHVAIAEACLHYLLIMFPVDVAETIGPEAFTLYPLGYYAKDFWWEHIRCAGEQAKPENWLVLAIERQDVRTVKLFLGHGADANGAAYGRQVLYFAAEAGCNEVVDTLVNLEADVQDFLEIEPSLENKPVIPTDSPAKREIAGMLLEAGANINAISHGHGTPLEVASRGNAYSLVRFLLKEGTEIDVTGQNLLVNLASSWCVDDPTIDIILQARADRDADRRQFRKAPDIACEAGKDKLGRRLIDRGVDIIQEDDDLSPLNIAARDGSCLEFMILLDAGADFVVSEDELETLLQASLHGRDKDTYSIIGRHRRAYSVNSIRQDVPIVRDTLARTSAMLSFIADQGGRSNVLEL
ncbi:MAG: hypothetical protein Q9226_003010 [Calogaya cf. arnoldii]